jgi:transcriptional regulator with XRE-family HTH domain
MDNGMGKRIKDKRLSLKMTLAELGNRAGVEASTVRKWETGYIKDMRSDKIQKVADALEVTPAYLMGWDESQNFAIVANAIENTGVIGQTNENVTVHGAPERPVSREEEELLRIYRVLSVKRRIELLTTALRLEEEEPKE